MPLPPGFIPYTPTNTPKQSLPTNFVPDETLNKDQQEAESLFGRFGKQLANAVPDTIKQSAYGLGGGKIFGKYFAYRLSREAKNRGIDLGIKDADKLIKSKMLESMGETIPTPFEIEAPENLPEKLVDVGAGLTKFVAELALLKKVFPAASEGSLWEIQNLMGGGMPGHGIAMNKLFGIPGKIIPGTSKLDKLFKLSVESALLGSATAIEQKLTTGEIDWEDVAISAAIPPALRSLEMVKTLVRSGNSKVLEAAKKVEEKRFTTLKEEQTVGGKPSNVYKTTDNQIHGIREGDIQFDKAEGKPYAVINGKRRYDIEIDKAASGTAIQNAPKSEQPAQKSAIETIKDWIPSAKEIKEEEWKPEVEKLRSRQAEEFTNLLEGAGDKPAAEAIRSAKAGFKDSAERPEVKPPEMSNAQWNELSIKAMEVYPGKGNAFRLSNFQESVDNLRYKGRIPTNYEFGLWEPVIGTEATLDMYNKLARTKYGPDVPKLIISALKSPFGYDPQSARSFSKIKFRHPLIYLHAIGIDVKAKFMKSYRNKIADEVTKSWAYEKGEEIGVNFLGTKPWSTKAKGIKRLQQYGQFTDWLLSHKGNGTISKILRKWGEVLEASELGSNTAIDWGMTKLIEVGQKQLDAVNKRTPLTKEQIDKFWFNRAKDINGLSKRVVATSPSMRGLQNAANYIMFSPAYTAAQPYTTWRAVSNLFRGTPANRTYALQNTVLNMAGITALSAIITSVAYKHRLNNPSEEPPIDSSLNPANSLWGHMRVGNNVYDFTYGDGSYYRLLARLGLSAYSYMREQTTGEMTTEVNDYRVPDASEEFMKYLNSRQTVAIGLGKTLITGKDWLGQPIPRPWALAKTTGLGIPISAVYDIIDALHAEGILEAWYNRDMSEVGKDLLSSIPPGVSGLFGVGVTSYPVSAASKRASYRDLIALDKFNKKWIELSPSQQRVLTFKNRKQFKEFDKQVQIENVENPRSIQGIKDEEKKSGDRIRKQLTKSNQNKVAGLSVNISRRPGDFYLNDKRYNIYEDLVIRNLNERLSKTKSTNEKVLMLIINMAKKKAWLEVNREIRKGNL